MLFRITLFLISFFVLNIVSAQKKDKNYNQGDAPKAVIYSLNGSSPEKLTVLKLNKDTRIKVELQGGIQNIKHEIQVTSKNAIIKNTDKPNEYIITPQKEEPAEIIVDVKTFEEYFYMKGEKKDRKVVRSYPPKTYMVGYERIDVKAAE